MPSKRAFAKRLAALAATGLGTSGAIDDLTAEATPDPALAAAAGADGPPPNGDESGSGAESNEPRSAVAAGTYDPAATASVDVDTVATARMDPSVLTATGLPSGIGARVRRLLGRYESVSLGGLRTAAGSVALTADGPAGCAVAVGDVGPDGLGAELDADAEFVRESGFDSGFARFRSERVGPAVAVAPGELVVACGPTADRAAAHRDAGVDGRERRRTAATASYGPLPALLGGDAVLCVDLGPETRGRLRRALADAPAALRAAVEAAGAVGASLRVTDGEPRSDGAGPTADANRTRDGDAGGRGVELRYGAVADPRRLDGETARTIARAARDGDAALSDATVARHGRAVTVDVDAGTDPFASQATLFGVRVGDRIEIPVV
jgi:hypothetical protein